VKILITGSRTARATDLTNLRPTFIDRGGAEVFRDEAVAYATAIWAADGQAELHVWPGGFHAFDTFAHDTVLSGDMIAARDRWISRLFHLNPVHREDDSVAPPNGTAPTRS